MKRIFVVGTRGVPNMLGGIETHCDELFPRIARMGFDVTVVRRTKYVEDNLKEWEGVKLVDVATPDNKSMETVVHTFRAIKAAKASGAEIVHIHAIGPALMAAYAKWLGLKVVMTHHGPDYDRDKWGTFAKFVLRMGERIGCRYADHVIVISDVIRNLIATKYGRTKNVHLIYNGVPKADVCDYPEYFKHLGIEPGRYILGMCRFVPEKNLHHLVEAYSRIDSKGCKLVLAGDTDFEDHYSKDLKSRARKAGVVLTGFVKGREQHSLLTHCRAYCLPSSHEGLPIALLEAMSYGAKVVVSDIPANLEVGLSEDCYFACGDIDALAVKLQEVVDSPLEKVEYDMSKYDWDHIASQVADVYRQM